MNILLTQFHDTPALGKTGKHDFSAGYITAKALATRQTPEEAIIHALVEAELTQSA